MESHKPQEEKAIFTSFLSPKTYKRLEEYTNQLNRKLGANIHTKQMVLERALISYLDDKSSFKGF